MPRPFTIRQPIRINAYDIDVMGIVSNIVYVRWFEDLRYSFLEKHLPYEQLLAQHLSPMLMKTEVTYHTPLTIRDQPFGEAWISGLGKLKWTMEFCISSAEAIHCQGTQTGCLFNLETRRPAPLPDDFVRSFQSSQEADAVS